MQFGSIIALALASAVAVEGCYFSITSSTVGTWRQNRREPKDNGGRRTYFTSTRGACTVDAEVLNGCGTRGVRTNGRCGSVSIRSIAE
ncbi:hypothetical protein FB567DRAFT_598574 [Paraphoma chrysanthemicola]|uniref:Uncharacterized protein n=1 Tax=Paraphoma chrysanthemicola TaxID=798071 RepID=A0A8K0VS63_9PLEO|nr:hypothetical protein FB567DRAFT_598574 [Paraphoma chrysanthemicola]